MYKAKAYSATSATSPLASTTISRREPTEHDVQLEILFCGICHSDLHTVRNEWSEHVPTVYPCVPGHEIVGRVTKVGPAVTKFKPGDVAAVGCMVDSDGTCPECRAGLEQFCPNMILTFNSPNKHLGGVTYGGYSMASSWTSGSSCASLPTSISRELRRSSAPESPLTRRCAAGRHQGKESRSGRPRRTGAHGREVCSCVRSHVVVFTTSPNKKEDALRLGADEVVVSRNANEMQKHAGSFDFILDAVSADHDINAYIQLLRRDANLTLVGAPAKPLAVAGMGFCSDAAASPARSSVVSPKPGDARLLRRT